MKIPQVMMLMMTAWKQRNHIMESAREN